MSETFTLRITLGNDAMRVASDVAEALRDVADKVEGGYSGGIIRDENGNTVGGFEGAPEASEGDDDGY